MVNPNKTPVKNQQNCRAKMKVAMQDVAKKLVLWHTPTFRPIITHDELEPIMASVGFASSSSTTTTASEDVEWKEYSFGPPQQSPPPLLIRLPFPRIDGLHLVSYKAFLSALEHYISSTEVYNLFHVRAMLVTCLQDRVFEKVYRPMKGCDIDEDGIYVFRDGTIDRTMSAQFQDMECGGEEDVDDRIKGCTSHTASIISLVPWDSLLPKAER